MDRGESIEQIVEQLAACRVWGYQAGAPSATEPTALAAIALALHGRRESAQRAARALASRQAADGSLGISAEEATPCWPTSLAILAWLTLSETTGVPAEFQEHIDRGIAWTLAKRGMPLARHEAVGHDSTLIGWPWVENTHSWIEPTALHLWSLKASGHGDHPHTREAVRLLRDRLLPGGGCNYGNTIVLGQELRPHIQPTAIAMIALQGEDDPDGRVGRSLDYLEAALGPTTTTVSLCFALIGTAAHGRYPRSGDTRLTSLPTRWSTEPVAPYHMALFALAAVRDRFPLTLAPAGVVS